MRRTCRANASSAPGSIPLAASDEKVTATPATGWAVWSRAATATDAKPGVTSPSSVGVTPSSDVGEQPPQGGERRGPACAVDERNAVREQRPHLRAGKSASIARPLAVRWAGSRTPTSVTSGGRPGARSSTT